MAQNKVKVRCMELQISLTELSFKTKIGQTTISKIANNRICVYPAWKRKIAAALETTEEALFPENN